ncbi:MAG: ADP-glyceromanno-heptose 6-epimerase [Candidatus Andersenbacteria bacterium]
MIIVTGGAGFIGSALVRALNERGETNVLIVDDVDHEEKEHNIGHLSYEQLVGIKDFRERLLAGEYDNAGVTAVLHMGACSDTTETDWEYLLDNNVQYSKDIIRWCFDRGVRCIYASSAAAYGDGEQGYSDSHDLFEELKPLNLYGKSKLEVDIWARDGKYLDKVVGLRYFNVFGPNEWHKEGMRSVICKKFPELAAGQPMTLFRSDDPDYQDGGQMRDFIYVKDVVSATLFFMDNEVAGVFNVGTGKARTWNHVAKAMFAALDKEPSIQYIDMPDNLKGQYQNFTQADIHKLQEAGFTQPFMTLEEAIADYILNYLVPHKHLGE